MIKVKLKGRLGLEFGEEWELDAKTPVEAFHAINMNTDGRFVRYLEETIREKNISYSFIVGNLDVKDEKDIILLQGPCGKEDVVVIPCIGGAGPATPFIVQLVVAIIMAVVSAMLAPSPDVNLGSSSDDARKDSYLFSGGPQPAKQGKPVPLGYGKMIVYPMPISVKYEYSSESFGNTSTGWYSDGVLSGDDAGYGGGYNYWGSYGGYFGGFDTNDNYVEVGEFDYLD